MFTENVSSLKDLRYGQSFKLRVRSGKFWLAGYFGAIHDKHKHTPWYFVKSFDNDEFEIFSGDSGVIPLECRKMGFLSKFCILWGNFRILFLSRGKS